MQFLKPEGTQAPTHIKDAQTDRQAARQAGTKTSRQADRLTYTQTDRDSHVKTKPQRSTPACWVVERVQLRIDYIGVFLSFPSKINIPYSMYLPRCSVADRCSSLLGEKQDEKSQHLGCFEVEGWIWCGRIRGLWDVLQCPERVAATRRHDVVKNHEKSTAEDPESSRFNVNQL